MNRSAIGFTVILAGVAIAPAPALAGTTGALYDMSRFLSEPHPFDITRPAGRATGSGGARAGRAGGTSAGRTRAGATRTGGGHGRKGGRGRLRHPFRDPSRRLPPRRGAVQPRKEDGIDANLEALFVSPEFLDLIFSPRPHLGLSANPGGDTNQVYLGLTWEWEFLENAFFDFAWGGTLHDGETAEVDPEKKALGCRVLFREAIDLGCRFQGHHGVMLHLDHASNAKLCDKNEGLESVGIRYGYRF